MTVMRQNKIVYGVEMYMLKQGKRYVYYRNWKRQL